MNSFNERNILNIKSVISTDLEGGSQENWLIRYHIGIIDFL